MVNIPKLKGRIVEKEKTIEWLAAKIGVDKATLYRRFNDPTAFTIKEIDGIIEALDLSLDDIVAIFCAQIVS